MNKAKLIGQYCCTQESWTQIVPSQDAEEESPPEATSSPTCSPLSATLSRIRLKSCSNQLRSSTEVFPLCTSSTYDGAASLHSHSSYHIKPSLYESSYTNVHHDYPLPGAPCACSSAAMLAQGTEDHATCMQQLLYNPSLQGRTWGMFGSVVHPSPFGSDAQGAGCFGRARGCSGSDVTEMLTHGSMVFTAHKDHNIRVWKLSTSPSCKHKLLHTLPTARDYLLNCFCERNYVQVRRHHHCLWIKHVDNISALAVGGTCTGKRDESVDPELLYSASWDKTFKVWRLSDFKCMESVVAHSDAITAIIFGSCSLASVHQKLLYTASSDGTVKAWTKEAIKTSTLLRKRMKFQHRLVETLPDHKCAVNALAISSDGTVLFSAGSDGRIRVWKRSGSCEDGIDDATSVQRAHMTLCSIVEGHKRAVLCLSIAGDDEVLLSGSADKTVRAWRIARSSESGAAAAGSCSVIRVLRGHKAPIKAVCAWPCVHGSGFTVYTAALDTSIKVWWLHAQNI